MIHLNHPLCCLPQSSTPKAFCPTLWVPVGSSYWLHLQVERDGDTWEKLAVSRLLAYVILENLMSVHQPLHHREGKK